jgi:hypothetical protein
MDNVVSIKGTPPTRNNPRHKTGREIPDKSPAPSTLSCDMHRKPSRVLPPSPRKVLATGKFQ